jgi:signal transduction histidine kinase
VAAVGAVLAGTLTAVVVLDRRLPPDLTQFGRDDAPYVLACLSALAVGAVLAIHRPRHPVGWLFLALGGSVLAGGLFEAYALYGAVVRPGALPGADLAAVLADAAFIPWFVLVALVLHLTPTGRPLSSRWGLAARLTVLTGALWFCLVLVWPGPLEPPFAGISSPLALPAGALGPLRILRIGTGVLTGLGLVVAGVSLLVRFRRSRGEERRRLLWLAIAVVPLPAYVLVAFLASPDHPVLLAAATSGFISLIPIATGLSVVRYHLYDVVRVLSRAVAYLLVSGVLAATFALVVGTAGRLVGDRAGSSVPAVLGTLAAVAVAAPAYRSFQEAVDRRFNRRRFDTLRVIRAYVRDPSPRTAVETVLRDALGDPGLRAAYWVEDRGQWVTGDGLAVQPGSGEVLVRRYERPVATIRYDSDAATQELVEAAAAEATPELENAGLRAAIALQLTEVRESRARIAAAQLAERRRIERDLHDGAQQRLLALALQLRAAQLNGDVDRLRDAAGAGAEEIQAAVAELRELANGLHPAVLGESGLAAALDDLASRLPVPVRLHAAVDRRYPAQVEAAAWFIACEAISNAVKHSGSDRIEVFVAARDGMLVLRVGDDGCGGADRFGSGLRGIADRAEAAGGRLRVDSRDGDGTTVTAELPCGS